MRDIFTDIFENQPLDPREVGAPRRAAPRCASASIAAQRWAKRGDGFPLLLDGKPVKTPARHALAAPTHALAEKIAAEWNAQENVIDPARMPLTRLANAVIDAVARAARSRSPTEIAKYLGSDLLCYRAEAPAGLVEQQTRHWDPVLAWARDTLGARFLLAQGVMHVAQPREAIAAAARAFPPNHGGWARSPRSRRSPARRCWRWRSPTARSMPRPSGPPRMSMRTGRCRNGAATSSRSSAALSHFAELQAAATVLALAANASLPGPADFEAARGPARSGGNSTRIYRGVRTRCG